MLKLEWNKKYFTVSVYAFIVIALSIIFYFGIGVIESSLTDFLSLLTKVLKPIIYGLMLAYILNPIVKAIEIGLRKLVKTKWLKKIKANKISSDAIRGLSVFFSWLIVLFFLSFMIAVIVPCINTNANKIFSNSSGYLNNANRWISDIAKFFSLPEKSLLEQVSAIFNYIKTFITNGLQIVISQAVSFTVDIMSKVVNVIVTCIISFHLLYSKETFCAQIKKTLNVFFHYTKVEKFFKLGSSINNTFNSFMFGKLIDSAIIGILCFIGTSLLRIPYAAFVSVVVGVTNIIPFFGPFIGAIPCSFIILLDNPIKFVWFVIFILILQQFDGNVLGPRILGGTIGIGSFWIIISIVLFGGLFGFIGMFLGTPLFAAIYTFIKKAVEERLTKKNMPTATTAYIKKLY